MLKRPFLIGSIIMLASALSLSNELAYKHFWYWRYWWFDLFMHFAGGLLLGFLVLWLYVVTQQTTIRSLPAWYLIQVTIFSALSLGLFWEFFEFGADRFFGSQVGLKTFAALQQGFRDSVGDLVFDVAGGFMAGVTSIIFSRWPKR